MTPDEVIELVKASGLRGRGGAGFPTGMKWQFVDKKSPKPQYIACNADESEPGTFKDHLLMERNPHLLIEGCADRLLRDRREGRLHLHPRRVLPRAARCSSARSTRPTRAGYPRQEHPRLRLRLRHLRAPRRRRLRSRRGDGAARVARRQARAAAHQAAVPRGRRPLRLPDRGQQRRDALQRAARSSTQRRRVVRGARSREERRPEAVLRQRPRQAPGRLRSVDERHAARADLRLRRRHRATAAR